MEVKKDNIYNYGIAMLKAFMCFIVILCHCWFVDGPVCLFPFSVLRPYAVPVFIFVSFFLLHKSFLQKQKTDKVKRIYKLFLPQLFWALIYFVVYFIVYAFVGDDKTIHIADLFWQIFTGHSPNINPSMWFQTDLIIVTVMFYIIFSLCKEKIGIIIISMLAIACLILQYSGINFYLFGSMRYELSYPLGRLAEIIPSATMGFMVARYKLFEAIKSRKINLIISIVLASLFLILDRKIIIPLYSFGYAGIWKIAFAYAIVNFAYNLNFDFINERGKSIIFWITKYTLGIYCVHRLVAYFVFNISTVFWSISEGEFYQCIIIYLVSYLMCFLISRLPFKFIKNVV